jgi:hypothetical protein
MTVPKGRWFRFSLRTLLVTVTIFATGGYWIARQLAFERAQQDYERAHAAWKAELILTTQLCEASRKLFYAHAAVPFVDRANAVGAHLGRLEEIRPYVIEGPAWDYDAGDKERAEFLRYYAEAQGLAATN